MFKKVPYIKFFLLLIFSFALGNVLPEKVEAAVTWTQTFSDDFNRANGAIGNTWEGRTSAATISNNTLGLINEANAWNGKMLQRPASESVNVNQRASVTYATSNPGALYLTFRVQGGNTAYGAGINTNSTNRRITLFKTVGGAITILAGTGNQSFLPAYDPTHPYRLDVNLVGTSPTVMEVTVTDLVTSNVIATAGLTDSTAELQQTGAIGMYGQSSTNYIDDFVAYTEQVTTPATAYTLTGPTSGTVGAATVNFTVTPNGVYTGTITPSDNGGGGSFTPSSLSFTSSTAAQTFTYTAASTGSKTISTVSSPGITNPSSLSVTVSAGPATAYTLTGPSSATNGQASSNFTVTPNGVYSGTITPSDSSGGGAFTPTALSFTSSTSAQTFTYTPGSTGVKTISTSSTPSLSNPSSLSVTVTSGTATSYTLTGPTSVIVGTASANFTVTPNAVYTGTITPSDGGNGGTFTPTSLTFSSSASAQTFTYTAASAGSKTISTASSPAITNPSSLSVTSYAVTPITNSNIFWSPYNWRFSGSDWAQTTPGGAYLKVAFSGTSLGLRIDTANMPGVTSSSVSMNAYIDGATSPVTRTLANVDANGLVNFSTSLSAGNHYAIIYLSKTSQSFDRWSGPANRLRITGIQLATGGVTQSLATTPLAIKERKILLYGDSITEGVSVTNAESAYSAVIGKQLGFEYGQVGYGSLGWTRPGGGGTAVFQDATSATASLWRRYDSTSSRLVDINNISSGFTDGAPDAVFVNMGTNDAANNVNTTTVRTRIKSWMEDIRTTIGPEPALFMISPFVFGNLTGNYPAHKVAFLGAIDDYRAAHPSDTRVYLLDLGTSGHATVVTYSGDSLHPNANGSAILGQQLADLARPLVSVFTTNSSSLTQYTTGNTVTLTGVNTLWSTNAPTFALTGGTGAAITNTVINSDTSITLTIDAGNALGVLTIEDIENDSSTTIDVTPDTTYPTISNITTTDLSASGVTISWTTDEPATSQIQYDIDGSYASESTLDTTLVTSHSVTLSGLSSGKTYQYRILSKDISNNLAASIQQTFTTPTAGGRAIGSAGPSFIRSTPIAIPVPPPTQSAVFPREFGTGTTGEDVRALQNLLISKGFLLAGNNTGFFGRMTFNALVAYQKSLGILPATGHFGPATRAAVSTQPSATTTVIPSGVPSVFSREFGMNANGEDVRALQVLLISQGYLEIGKNTGFFGPLTKEALIKFQTAKGILPATGHFGPKTREVVK